MSHDSFPQEDCLGWTQRWAQKHSLWESPLSSTSPQIERPQRGSAEAHPGRRESMYGLCFQTWFITGNEFFLKLSILIWKKFTLLFKVCIILFCFESCGLISNIKISFSVIQSTLGMTRKPKHTDTSKLVSLPPRTTPFVQIADMEIPVSVVTTTLRQMMITPRPAKPPIKVFGSYLERSHSYFRRKQSQVSLPTETWNVLKDLIPRQSRRPLKWTKF